MRMKSLQKHKSRNGKPHKDIVCIYIVVGWFDLKLSILLSNSWFKTLQFAE